MTDEKAYVALIDRCRTGIFGLPESELLLPLFKIRFTREEAAFLLDLPDKPQTIEDLVKRFSLPAEELKAKMEPMVKKGFIREYESKSGARYSFSDPMFFFYRMPGWKGEDDEWNRKISPMLNKYYVENLGAEVMGHPTRGLRAIPVGQTIKDTRQILPYEDVLEYVLTADYHAVATCPCRHRHNLDPSLPDCKHDTETCLHFGQLARYMVENGMGRQIAREETLEILKKAADAGLVHGISNTKTGIDTICNCCSCCCQFLEPVKMPHLVMGKHQRSNYRVQVNPETCQACGLCAQRCPVQAIELKGKDNVPKPGNRGKLKSKDLKEVAYDPDQCIGCGACAHKCPTQSLSLVRRGENEEDIPENVLELGKRLLSERKHD
ncbi:MAG: 4Fe-4S binding protein [Desulfomonile tiedjei]|nr:4Fe-4S binding protein [Desulfomonile tiedjei]